MKKFVLTMALFTISIANAQKLPNVQTTSLRAPVNLKIDGKTTEWDNKFQAYNHATSLYYTMANDDDNLYLIVQTNDEDALTKLTNAGILFNIHTSGKKSDEGAISINYPYFDFNKKPFINFKAKPQIKVGSPITVLKADSFMNASNKRLDNCSKYIKIKGIPGIDTLLSVYNEDGFKVREAFDNTMAYTFELTIPLKYLKITDGNSVKFTYHMLSPGISYETFSTATTDGAGHVVLTVLPGAVIPSKDHLAAGYATTDFWGEYTLAKK